MILPHGSSDFGSSFAKFTAALLYDAGSMRLLTNGARNAICRPTLQAGEVKAVQSPVKIAAVGTNARFSGGSCRMVVPWYPPKKNSLFLVIGPPIVPPNWLRLIVSRLVAKAFRALKIPLRTNSNRLPWNSLVPDFVTRLTVPEDFMPFCADVALVSTLNSCIASGNGIDKYEPECWLLWLAPSSV